jgi:FixJ family two-component response regulator
LHTVCIIDDDESVRVATTCLLRSLGHVVRTFASAEEFLNSPYLDEAACLIVDVNMPRLSGLELQSRLREGVARRQLFSLPPIRKKEHALGHCKQAPFAISTSRSTVRR